MYSLNTKGCVYFDNIVCVAKIKYIHPLSYKIAKIKIKFY